MKTSFLTLLILLFLFSCSEQKTQKNFVPERTFNLDTEVSNLSYTRELLAQRSIKKVLLFGDSVDLERGETRRVIRDTLKVISSSFRQDRTGCYFGEVVTNLIFMEDSVEDSLILKEIEIRGERNKWLLHFSSGLIPDQIILPTFMEIDDEIVIESDIFLPIEKQYKKPVEDLFDIQKDSVILNFSFCLEKIRKKL